MALWPGGEAFDAVAEGGGSRHGEGGADLLRRLGDIAEGVDIIRGIGADGNDVGIAGVFTLGEEVTTEAPDEGIEPMHEASEASGERGPKIASHEVAEFMEEDHAQRFFGPITAVLWKINDGMHQARHARRAFALAEVERDGKREIELLASLL